MPGPATGPWPAIDLTALRALKESRTDVEALDLTNERLRHLTDAFTRAADRAQATMLAHRTRCEDDPRAYRPEQPGPRHGREADR
ncbi:hypothetical protein [Streptomyces angustmyceticus]|uniref:hypothetical protein n=1 Tax=Streptomyces angustmyceticus TaxID=285578 RepID=UPI003450347A